MKSMVQVKKSHEKKSPEKKVSTHFVVRSKPSDITPDKTTLNVTT